MAPARAPRHHGQTSADHKERTSGDAPRAHNQHRTKRRGGRPGQPPATLRSPPRAMTRRPGSHGQGPHSPPTLHAAAPGATAQRSFRAVALGGCGEAWALPTLPVAAGEAQWPRRPGQRTRGGDPSRQHDGWARPRRHRTAMLCPLPMRGLPGEQPTGEPPGGEAATLREHHRTRWLSSSERCSGGAEVPA